MFSRSIKNRLPTDFCNYTGLDYLSSSRTPTRAFKCRGWRANQIRHRPLNIEPKGISLYQIVFEEYQKSASYRFL